jgi:hypothetical protein
MQISTAAFAAQLDGGAKLASRAVIYSGQQVKEDTFYNGSELVLITSDSKVDYDRLSDSRSSATLKFLCRTQAGQDMLDPVAYPEVTIHSGVLVGSTYEWIDMGTFGVFDISYERTGHGVFASCSLGDRSTRIRDNAWKQPFQIAAGIDYYTGILNIVNDRARGFLNQYNISSSALTTPSMTFSETDDPWAAVLKLAQAAGAEAYYDRQGALTAMPITDPKLIAPSIILSSNTASILVTPVGRQFGNREVFNGVICRGEAPWLLFPVFGEVWDDDPLSPSYRLGPFGEKPKVIGDSLATTNAQCVTAAQAEFLKISGVIETITFNNVKDPRVEVGDVIQLKDDDLGIYGRYVLDTYSFPLGPGPANGIVRRKR